MTNNYTFGFALKALNHVHDTQLPIVVPGPQCIFYGSVNFNESTSRCVVHQYISEFYHANIAPCVHRSRTGKRPTHTHDYTGTSALAQHRMQAPFQITLSQLRLSHSTGVPDFFAASSNSLSALIVSTGAPLTNLETTPMMSPTPQTPQNDLTICCP